jgi:hypothetical protein
MKKQQNQATEIEALKVAKSIQKPNQTKEQTKLIAQGIEKGIAEYKKQQSKKSRERDKAKKQIRKEQARQENPNDSMTLQAEDDTNKITPLPWLLLVASWFGFLIYLQF